MIGQPESRSGNREVSMIQAEMPPESRVQESLTDQTTTLFSTSTCPPCSRASLDQAPFVTVLNVKSPASRIVSVATRSR